MTGVDMTLLNRIDEDLLVSVCRDLVRLRTVNPPGDERRAAEYVTEFLRPCGFQGSLSPHDGGETRASALCRLKGDGRAPALMLNGHLDVVPEGAQQWVFDPFEAKVEGGRVWGRGSADMKGGLAAMLVAARVAAEAGLSLSGDLVVAATAGEEVNMMGAKEISALPDLGPLQAVVIAEPTNNEVGVAERGVFWLEFATQGKTAHGSTPHLGKNAVMMMLHFLEEFDRLEIPFTPHPIVGNFTKSINTISGGVKTNVVPDRCVATVDMRTVPGQSHAAILEQVEGLLQGMAASGSSFKGSVRVTFDLPPVETDPGHPAARRFTEAVQEVTGRRATPRSVPYATEAAIFVPALGVPVVICGPGNPALAHQPDEYVEVERLVEAAKIYLHAIVKMLA